MHWRTIWEEKYLECKKVTDCSVGPRHLLSPAISLTPKSDNLAQLTRRSSRFHTFLPYPFISQPLPASEHNVQPSNYSVGLGNTYPIRINLFRCNASSKWTPGLSILHLTPELLTKFFYRFLQIIRGQGRSITGGLRTSLVLKDHVSEPRGKTDLFMHSKSFHLKYSPLMRCSYPSS